MSTRIDRLSKGALVQLRQQTLEKLELINSLITQRELEGEPLSVLRKRWYLYVLKLENDCWYVGITTGLKRRYSQHKSGKATWFTLENKPIRIEYSKFLGVIDEGEAARAEDKMTLMVMKKYGREKVRGGSFTQHRINNFRVRAGRMAVVLD